MNAATTLGRARHTTPVEELTDEELEAGVIPAVFYSVLDAARCYGLVVGGPSVNADRCEEVIAEARRRGLAVPTPEEAVDAWIEGARDAG